MIWGVSEVENRQQLKDRFDQLHQEIAKKLAALRAIPTQAPEPKSHQEVIRREQDWANMNRLTAEIKALNEELSRIARQIQ